MLSLKATLKAIGESITTIKSALDGKATKYTGYGTPVTLTLGTQTIPSDGIIHLRLRYNASLSVTIKKGERDLLWVVNHTADDQGHHSLVLPVFKGQIIRFDYSGNLNEADYSFYPFV